MSGQSPNEFENLGTKEQEKLLTEQGLLDQSTPDPNLDKSAVESAAVSVQGPVVPIGWAMDSICTGEGVHAACAPISLRQLVPFPNPDDPLGKIHCASICIYPARIKDAIRRFKELNTHLPIACVAGGFPSGQYLFETRLLEVRRAIEHGANEIDVVIDRSLVLDGDWEQLFSEIRQFKDVCAAGNVHLKVILSTGELATKRNIYDASMTAMMAGADFIKTSTGKEVTNATLESAFVMCKAIKRYHALTGRRVGFKPAGGIKTAEQAAQYLLLVRDLLGQEWATPTLFRIGASSLLDDICEKLATP